MGSPLAYRLANKDKARAYCERYRRNHKEDITVRRIEQERLWRIRVKLATFDAYGGAVCACCGETLFEGLTIDHINGDGKAHRKVAGAGTSLYRWLQLHEYPRGYQVLCATCNLAKGTGDHCPHRDAPKEKP